MGGALFGGLIAAGFDLRAPYAACALLLLALLVVQVSLEVISAGKAR